MQSAPVIMQGCRTGFPYWLFLGFTTPSGVELMNAGGTEAYHDRPALIDALQYWVDLSRKYKVLAPGVIEWGTTPKDFFDKKMAMMWTTTGNLTNVKANAKFDFGVAVRPDAWETPKMKEYVKGFPAAVTLYHSIFSNPKKGREAARVEGANALQVLWKVYVPLARPTWLAYALVSVSHHWNNFLWSIITAATLMTSGPLLIAFLLFQRQLVQSLMRGGFVKARRSAVFAALVAALLLRISHPSRFDTVSGCFRRCRSGLDLHCAILCGDLRQECVK